MNVLAVKTFMMVGADTAYQYLLDFGFTTIDERDKAATTALGGLTQGVPFWSRQQPMQPLPTAAPIMSDVL